MTNNGLFFTGVYNSKKKTLKYNKKNNIKTKDYRNKKQNTVKIRK